MNFSNALVLLVRVAGGVATITASDTPTATSTVGLHLRHRTLQGKTMASYEDSCIDAGITTLQECGTSATDLCIEAGFEQKFLSTFTYEDGDCGAKYCIVRCEQGGDQYDVCGVAGRVNEDADTVACIPDPNDKTGHSRDDDDVEDEEEINGWGCYDMGIHQCFCDSNVCAEDTCQAQDGTHAWTDGCSSCQCSDSGGSNSSSEDAEDGDPLGTGTVQADNYEDHCVDMEITSVEECSDVASEVCSQAGFAEKYMSTFTYEYGKMGPKYCVVRCEQGGKRYEICGVAGRADPDLFGEDATPGDGDPLGTGTVEAENYQDHCLDAKITSVEQCSAIADDVCEDEVDLEEGSKYMSTFSYEHGDCGAKYCVVRCIQGGKRYEICGKQGRRDPELTECPSDDENESTTGHEGDGDGDESSDDENTGWACYDSNIHQCNCDPSVCSESLCTSQDGDHAWTDGCSSCQCRGDYSEDAEDGDPLGTGTIQSENYEDQCSDAGITSVEECRDVADDVCADEAGIDEKYMSTFTYEYGKRGPKYCVVRCEQGGARYEICGIAGRIDEATWGSDATPGDGDPLGTGTVQTDQYEDQCIEMEIATPEDCGDAADAVCAEEEGVEDKYMSTFSHEHGDCGPKYCVVRCTKGSKRYEICGVKDRIDPDRMECSDSEDSATGHESGADGAGDDDPLGTGTVQANNYEDQCTDAEITSVEDCGDIATDVCQEEGFESKYMSTFTFEHGNEGAQYCVVRCEQGGKRYEICGQADRFPGMGDVEDTSPGDGDPMGTGTIQVDNYADHCTDVEITSVEDCSRIATGICNQEGFETKYMSTFTFEHGDSGAQYCVVRCEQGGKRYEICGQAGRHPGSEGGYHDPSGDEHHDHSGDEHVTHPIIEGAVGWGCYDSNIHQCFCEAEKCSEDSCVAQGSEHAWTSSCSSCVCTGMEVVSIADLACKDDNFSTLCSLVSTCDILKEDGEYTVFAPTNEAFEELDQLIGLESLAEETVCEILKFHIVDGKTLHSTEVNCDSGVNTLIEMMNGKHARFKCSARPPVPYGIKGGGNVTPAGFVEVDLEASNGVVHVIDTVLFFPQLIDSTFVNVDPSFRSDIP